MRVLLDKLVSVSDCQIILLEKLNKLGLHARKTEQLANEKVDHINVSLHSLKPDVFEIITGDDLSKVLLSIRKALELGLKHP